MLRMNRGKALIEKTVWEPRLDLGDTFLSFLRGGFLHYALDSVRAVSELDFGIVTGGDDHGMNDLPSG